MSEPFETFEQAQKRTGRKWPYRTPEWPCPACGKAECDEDIDMTWKGKSKGVWTFVYAHREATPPPAA